MPTESISLDLLAKQSTMLLEEMRLFRKDMADRMRLLNATYDLARRIERREAERHFGA
nr:hypothetical protein [uncultured Gellertiella sp.]